MARLRKEFTQSGSATTGLTAYSLEGAKRLYPELLAAKRKKKGLTSLVPYTRKYDVKRPCTCALLKRAVPVTAVHKYVNAAERAATEVIHKQLQKMAAQWAGHLAAHDPNITKFDEAQHPCDSDGRFGYGDGKGKGMSKARDANGKPTGPWLDKEGKEVDAATQAYMAEIKVKPGWVDVHLNPDRTAGLLATGRDSKGREQAIYSAAHNEGRDAAKFDKIAALNEAMPAIKAQALSDMQDKALSTQERDTAAATYLIAQSGFRIGGEAETGAETQAYGASNMMREHVTVAGDTLSFNFTGKKGVSQAHDITDSGLASYISSKPAGESSRLFQTNETKVRDYFHSIAPDPAFKVKDMRMWNGTAEAVRAISEMPAPKTAKEYTAARNAVGERVAALLGNTRNVALAAYIHPAVFHVWSDHGE
jgi:DNA topoisomerase-1